MKCISYSDFFTNFANKTRFDMIMALNERPLSVTDISKTIGEEQSKVSHNLKILLECRITTFEQKGKQRIYTLNKETIIPILKLIDKHTKMNCERCRKHED